MAVEKPKGLIRHQREDPRPIVREVLENPDIFMEKQLPVFLTTNLEAGESFAKKRQEIDSRLSNMSKAEVRIRAEMTPVHAREIELGKTH